MIPVQKYAIAFLIMGLIVLLNRNSHGQEYNPFELEERLEQNISQGERVPADRTNPYEIEYTRPLGADIQKNKEKEQLKERFTRRQRRENNLEFWIIIFITLAFAFAVSFYRIFLNNLFKSILNINVMARFHRDRKYFQLPLTFFYMLYFANLSFFICVLMNEFWSVAFSLRNLVFVFLAVAGAILAKHALISFTNFLLQKDKEIKAYNFAIRIYGIAIGIVLMPVNIVFTLEYQGLESFLIYLALSMIAALMGLRYIRGVMIARPYLPLHLFHFFMYLCTVEFAPIILIRNVFLAIE